MELVRDHRRIGRVVGDGTCNDGRFIGVEWSDFTSTYVPMDAVKKCDPQDGVRNWVMERLFSLVCEMEHVGIDNGLSIVREAMKQFEAST